MLKRRLQSRLLLATAGALAAVALLEGGLRAIYPTLPSLAPLVGLDAASLPLTPESRATAASPGWMDAGCVGATQSEPRPIPWSLQVGRCAAEPCQPLTVWAVGDSVTRGAGVEPKESFPALLGERLAEGRGVPVTVASISVLGGNYCQYLRELDGWLGHQRPDLVVIGVFADDLEDRAIYLVQGEVVGFPSALQSPTSRWIVEHSYVANEVWRVVRSRTGERPGRVIHTEVQAHFQAAFTSATKRLAELRVPVVIALIAPTGMPLCADSPNLEETCTSMRDDAALMFELLEAAGLSVLDLRTLWDDRPPRILPTERERLEKNGALPVHPDIAGHRDLADAIWPSLEPALPR